MYKSRITSKHPASIIFLIDQSASMREMIRHEGVLCTKAQLVSHYMNFIIEELIDSCRSFDSIKPYLNIAVLGYAGYGIKSLLKEEKDFLFPHEILALDCLCQKYSFIRKMPNGKPRLFTKLENCWVNPHAEGSTPMGKAITYATKLSRRWCKKNANSFAPLVINITDGAKSDCFTDELINKAQELKSVCTNDGKLIFMNIHISNQDDSEQGILFPENENELPEKAYAELLYKISSSLPSQFYPFLRSLKGSKSDASGFKAMTFNLSGKELFSILKIGSITISSQK